MSLAIIRSFLYLLPQDYYREEIYATIVFFGSLSTVGRVFVTFTFSPTPAVATVEILKRDGLFESHPIPPRR
jgi:hypothetical protein